MARRMLVAACTAVALLVAADAGARWPPATKSTGDRRDIDASMHEDVRRIEVPGTGASIVVSSYRPVGEGPHPWIVLSHGTAATRAQNRKIDRYQNAPLFREWLRRGYAVIVPVRRGYGASGGDHAADDYGACNKPDFRRAGEAAAADLLATIAWAKTQGDLDPKRWLLVGQSAGGFASIYTASKRPAGLVAVLAFSPGRGAGAEGHRGNPCGQDDLAALYASIAPGIAVPVLWFYAENDELVGRRAPKLWFDSFRKAGGRGELVIIPHFAPAYGHGVFPSPQGVPFWTAAVTDFYRHQKIDLPF